MKPIVAEKVEKTWREVAGLKPQEAQALLEQMVNQQPAVFAYLMNLEQRVFSDKERDFILYLGLVVWRTMTRVGKSSKVTEQDIEIAESANLSFLETLDRAEKEQFDTVVEDFFTKYNQQDLFKVAIEALGDRPNQKAAVRSENVGLAMLHVKTIIDVLDQ